MKIGIAAIDCGTSAIKGAIFDCRGNTQGIITKPSPCFYKRDGAIEQDPNTLVHQVCSCLQDALRHSRIPPKNIISVSVASQRATLICTDRHCRPIGNAISWQDLRGIEEIKNFAKEIKAERFYQITGLPLHPVFSLAKILWMKKHAAPRFRQTTRFVLVHDYLLKKLGASDFFCDFSNASLTGFLETPKLKWSHEILALLGIPKHKLPELVASGKQIGTISPEAARRCGLLAGTPIITGGGDQQCAGIGSGCMERGILSLSLGTAAVSLGLSEHFVRDPKMRVACCAHAIPGKWEIEGLQNSAASCLGWFKQISNGSQDFPQSFFKQVSRVPAGSAGILFYPFLAGASAPNWNPKATASFFGLRHGQNQHTIVRSILEGITLETKQILAVFASLKLPIKEIRVTGGGAKYQVWNQIQSDIFARPVITLKSHQASLLGAAVLAGYGVGIFSSVPHAAREMVHIWQKFRPNLRNQVFYARLYRKYCEIYQKLESQQIFNTFTGDQRR